jgi:hypothetical protein
MPSTPSRQSGLLKAAAEALENGEDPFRIPDLTSPSAPPRAARRELSLTALMLLASAADEPNGCDLCDDTGSVWADWVGVDGGPGWIDCPVCGDGHLNPEEDR